ncbi:hypothetical protein C8R47DRAFT_1102347 [Mycena vitilis]|nr:hypothetical protein C8R47DRAFT_1102347 [Mycena vitilis]
MNFLAALLASFVAAAAANPMHNAVARQHCDLLPFLRCKGGLSQDSACDGHAWTCPGNGLHPITSNATCAAQCTCIIPCPS